jgi:hypothetical protein
MQLRRAGQAAKAAGDQVAEKRVRRQLTNTARLAARLGFSSPTAYEDWLARGAPEEELPAECRHDPDAPVVDDESSERLQLRSDAAIAKMRGVSASVVTAERKRTEPQPPRQSILQPAPRDRSPWDVMLPVQFDDDAPFEEPFPVAGRAAPRRQGSGYWGH